MKSIWDERYASEEYIYGEIPNRFFAEQLAFISPGRILLPAEGEGRNAVHASINGWEVSAFDQSSAARSKAMRLAAKHGVQVNYAVTDILSASYLSAQFDALALVFVHFPATQRHIYHRHLVQYLPSGGLLILEGFSKKHKAHQRNSTTAGGPSDESMLFSIDEIALDFNDFETILLEETEIHLSEGSHHIGKASVLRFVGRKI